MIDLDEIKTALAAATPGPWEVVSNGDGNDIAGGGWFDERDEPYPGNNVCFNNGPDGVPDYDRWRYAIIVTDSGAYPPCDVDASLIVLLRNNAAALVDEVERLRYREGVITTQRNAELACLHLADKRAAELRAEVERLRLDNVLVPEMRRQIKFADEEIKNLTLEIERLRVKREQVSNEDCVLCGEQRREHW